MNRLTHKNLNKVLRRGRTRSHIKGTAQRPRLSVHISNRHVTAQLIDDASGKTVAYVSTVGDKVTSGKMSERAASAGSEIARKAKAAKVKRVVFDRGSKLYHGRMQALAEAARKEGLEF